MEELGIPIDLAGGTSHGAVVAAAVADRRTSEDMQASARPWVGKLRDYTIPVVAVMRGRLLGRTLAMIVRPETAIEDLWLPYFAMTTNLSRAERVVQDRGDVASALRASVSLPVVLPPVIRDGELFIDGGLLDNLPVAEMRRRMGPGAIVAVDPTPKRLAQPYDALEPDVSGWRLLAERLVPFRRRRHVPSIGDIIQRTMMAGSLHLRQRDRGTDADTLLLNPQLGDWGLLAFERLDEIVEAGYREMRGPLEAWWRERGRREDATAADRLQAPPGER
jgi:predicted acylesterase/phospholipase RssA